MKKLTAAIIVFISLITAVTPVFAADTSEVTAKSTQIEIIKSTENSAKDENAATENLPVCVENEIESIDSIKAETEGIKNETDFLKPNEYAAIMYLCVSGPHSHYVFGHTWICIKNIGDETITIGNCEIQSGEMASFGLHHFDGMHCDDEMHDYSGETVKAREYKLTSGDLSKAASEITNSKWHWYEYLTHNCTNFATSVWNKVTGSHYFAFCFPVIVQLQMAGSGLMRIEIQSK